VAVVEQLFAPGLQYCAFALAAVIQVQLAPRSKLRQ
jgi:hypothetical protein